MRKRRPRTMLLNAVACALLAGCAEDQPVAIGASGDDAATGAADGAQLRDGWQLDKDATAPDGWIWSDDAGAWIGPDGTGVSDATGADATEGSSDTSAKPDGAADSDTTSSSDVPAAPGTLGGFCKTIADCPKGAFCAAQGTAEAYCSTYGCATAGDCANIPSADLICCVSYGAGSQKESYCLKQFGATQCGKQDQPVGGDCKTGGQSDCTGVDNWCFQTSGGSKCVQTCTALNDPICGNGTTCNVFPGGAGCLPYTPGVPDGSPCAQNTLGGCGKYAFCIENQKGDPLAYCATACKKDADCAAGLSCFLYDGAQGICQKNGPKQIGDNCAGDRFSCAKGLYCVGFGGGSAVCAPQCTTDADCGAMGTALGASAYCATNPGNPTGICYPKGSGKNGSACADNPFVCGQGLYCIGGYDDYNPGAFCQQQCGNGSACPAGSSCTQYDATYSGCQPDGNLGQGGDCQGNPTLCKAGEFCIGAGKSWECMTQCALTSPACPANTWCMAYGQDGLGICWPTGQKPVGTSCFADPWGCQKGALCGSYGLQANATCLQGCDSGNCPSGFSCDDFGQSGHWCQPVGPGAQGTSCGVGAACQAGEVCVGQEGPAPFCAKQCAADTDCPATDANGQKLWCAKGKWGGFCIPDGGLQKNAICYQKPWACAKGLICLGDSVTNPGAFCAESCAGFASVCAPGEKCEYLGGGDAFCFKTGSLPAGSDCLTDPLGCAPDTLCIKGSPLPMCVQQCGVGFATCPADSPCTSYVGSPVKLCVPKGFVPFGVIAVPF